MPIRTETYFDFPALAAWAEGVAARHPQVVSLAPFGHSRNGRPLLLLTLALRGAEADPDAPPPDERPALWIDAGTHAAEWAGVMGAVHCVERLLETLSGDDAAAAALRGFLARNAIFVAPCLSPDGFQAICEGGPQVRSTLRPPRAGEPRVGHVPRDIDGDGAIRTMRWRHPAGPFVADRDVPLFLRPRTLDDDPAEALFACDEGDFLHFDGETWRTAPLENGLDLNRNFPAHWAPFSMFGMDGGAFALSEPESRATVDAVAARPGIAAGLTLHTYTGALLTQPYRKPSPLGPDDLDLMERLAQQAVAGTGWRTIRVHPDFMYDPDRPIVGVWADTLSTVFGVPGYTLEIWDPFGHAGLKLDKPAEYFKRPESALMRALVEHYSRDVYACAPWRPFDHPQLGPVEIGGLDYMRTIRNPPLSHLNAECEKVFQVAERLRRALPEVELSARIEALGGGLSRLRVRVENRGYLPTPGLAHGAQVAACPGGGLTLALGPGLTLVEGQAEVPVPPLDGWGSLQVGGSGHPIYPGLPVAGGPRHTHTWLVRGAGEATVTCSAHRGGLRRLRLAIPGA